MKMSVFVMLFLLSVLFAANPAPSIAACDYQIALYDSFGDGWNGATVTVYVEGVPVLSNITLATGSGPQYYSFSVEDGDEISTGYTQGSWPQEPYYDIIDSEGNIVATDGAGSAIPGGLSGITAVCPNAKPIPTLSEWGMIILAMMLGASAILVLKRQKRSLI